MRPLFTIGYEGSSLDEFLDTLLEEEVETLIDVREVPLSRKRGFSKSLLCNAVESVGIEYVHLKSLGDPKEGRVAARNGEIDLFKEIYRRHLRTKAAREALELSTDIALNSASCLMCYERYAEDCHRNIVANRIKYRTGMPVRHLLSGASHSIGVNAMGAKNERTASRSIGR